MSSTTRWEFDSSLGTLNDVSRRINKNKRTSVRIKNLNVILTNSNNGNPLILKINFNVIKFYVFSISYTKVLPHKRIDYNDKFLILYEDTSNNSVYAIINKNTGAKPLLRFIFNITGTKKVKQSTNYMNSTLIMWLIQLVYYKEPLQTSTKNGLKITYMTGFSGNIANTDTTVNIHGDNIINLLSSLSFILEASNMSRIVLWLSFKSHRHIMLSLSVNDTVTIKEYSGSFVNTKFKSKYGDKCDIFLPYLLVYCEILPLINLLFKESSFSNPIASKTLRIQFLNDLISKIESRVHDKAKDIENE